MARCKFCECVVRRTNLRKGFLTVGEYICRQCMHMHGFALASLVPSEERLNAKRIRFNQYYEKHREEISERRKKRRIMLTIVRGGDRK